MDNSANWSRELPEVELREEVMLAMEEAGTGADHSNEFVGVKTTVVAPAACDIGGDQSWHTEFTWWMDGIAMLIVGKDRTSCFAFGHPNHNHEQNH